MHSQIHTWRVLTYAWMHAHTQTCTHVPSCTHMQTCTHIMHTHTCRHAPICPHACAQWCAYADMHTCSHAYALICPHARTHTCTCAHTHITQTFTCSCAHPHDACTQAHAASGSHLCAACTTTRSHNHTRNCWEKFPPSSSLRASAGPPSPRLPSLCLCFLTYKVCQNK